MHVLSVIHYPVYGGPHNRNAMVIPELAKRGITTTVVVPSEPGNAFAKLAAQGIDVIALPIHRLRGARNLSAHVRLARGFPGDVRALRRLIGRADVDAVIVNGLVNPQAAVAGHLQQRAVVWQILDTFPPMAMRRAVMPLVTQLADVVMSTGNATAAVHPGALSFGDRLVPFFPVVDTAIFRVTPERRLEARQRLGLPPHAIVVGNIGNINPMKGHDVFVRAAAIVHRSHPETRFAILGAQYAQHARYADRLWREAAGLGLSLGRELMVREPETGVADLAAAFDIFWLTSNPRSEGIPTVVGEAMALEIPVVATNVGSVMESVDDGVTGTLVKARDAQAVADATIPFITDPALRARAGAAGRARALRLYSVTACADRHQEALVKAINYGTARATRR